MNQYQSIPIKERIKMRNRKIKMLYRYGFSMDEVCGEMKKLGYNVSKTTVFFAINGRSKKADDRRKRKGAIIRKLNHLSK
jgi:hypothetical protein